MPGPPSTRSPPRSPPHPAPDDVSLPGLGVSRGSSNAVVQANVHPPRQPRSAAASKVVRPTDRSGRSARRRARPRRAPARHRSPTAPPAIGRPAPPALPRSRPPPLPIVIERRGRSRFGLRSNAMAPAWTSAGLDLQIETSRSRRRASLEESLREAIQTRRLAAGTALPSSRALARDLGLSRGTVTAAYDQLTAEGYLQAQQGAGTRVADLGPAHEPAPSRRRTGTAPLGPAPGHARRRLLPGGGLVAVPASGAQPRPERRLRLRRPARHPAAAPRAGRLPGAHPRRAGRPRPGGDHQRVDRSAGAARPGPRGHRKTSGRHGGPGVHLPPGGGAPRRADGAAAGRRRGRARIDDLTAAGAARRAGRRAHPRPPVPDRRHPRAASPARGGGVGATASMGWSSRTTTTASSATTASRSAPSRGLPPSTSPTPAPRPRRSDPGCGWAGWCCRTGCWTPCSWPRASPAAVPRSSPSSRWPS